MTNTPKFVEERRHRRKFVFDIETGPLPEERMIFPNFSAPSNYKDEEKIAAHIENQRKEYIDRAALSATTGQVLAIGYAWGDDAVQIECVDTDADGKGTRDERGLLEWFWGIMEEVSPRIITGFNIMKFDLPFLVRRSWVHGLRPPAFLRPTYGNRWGFNAEICIDLMTVWGCGVWGDSISLDSCCSVMGIPGKNGSGKFFSQLLKEDRTQALFYLRNDVGITRALANRLIGEF